MEEKTFQRIKELTELQGTSGFEEDIRSYLRTAITPLVDDVQQDGLGGIFGQGCTFRWLESLCGFCSTLYSKN